MNKILKLYDEKYVKDLLTKEVLPLYPSFSAVKKVEIIKHKTNVWEKTYHIVVEFLTTFESKDGQEERLPIFCSAHSEEPRENVYDALKYLWDNGFDSGSLTIPHALFYSKYFGGIFYRGVSGRNLYRFIREKNYTEIEKTIPLAAKWFAKLHQLSTTTAKNFNKENSRIETVFPGVDHILEKIQQEAPEHYNIYKQSYDMVINREKKFLKLNCQRWLVHGDAHPENIIKMSDKKIAVIDFTDLCLSDFARDLGTFLQQLGYMVERKIGDKKYSEKVKKIFLDNYFENVNIKSDKDLEERINTYYNWTALRTATYFILKPDEDSGRAEALIEQVRKNLNIA